MFRRYFLQGLQTAHGMGKLRFYGEHAALADAKLFSQWLAPMRDCEWVVYAKKPFAGPQAVLAYLSRYTHRVAISNSRLVRMDEHGVCFRWKDYRDKSAMRHKTMTLAPEEFMRRFLLHVLPSGFHRIRHYGLLCNTNRRSKLAQVRALLAPSSLIAPAVDKPMGVKANSPVAEKAPTFVCSHCGAAMLIVETIARRLFIRAPPIPGTC